VDRAGTRAYYNMLCHSAARSSQAGRYSLELGVKRKMRPSQPWTSEDEVRLRTLAAAGRSAATIAERLKRTEAAIRYKARALNIILARVANGRQAQGE
jgi:DNA-binding NarL/FixJ family response regulator